MVVLAWVMTSSMTTSEYSNVHHRSVALSIVRRRAFPGGGFLTQGGIPPQNLSGISVLKPADARSATSAFLPNNVKYPYSETWNLGIQHVFAKEYTADIRYVGTRGVDLNVQNRLNFVSGAAPGHEVPTFINAPSAATVAGLTTAWASADPGCNDGTSNTCQSGAGDFPGTLAYRL